MGLLLQSMAIEMPLVERHPNRAEFRGVLTFVDAPSDKPPSGAKGHRVVLTKEAADAALPSLLGMALDYTPSLDRHDARMKIGVITSAEVVTINTPTLRGAKDGAPDRIPGQNQHPHPSLREGWGTRPQTTAYMIEVSGYLFARDFPEVISEMRAAGRNVLGMSYEIADARIADMKAPVWMITSCTFTGAALLRRDKAAYRNTWIELSERKLPANAVTF
jgi:hypothetical protein